MGRPQTQIDQTQFEKLFILGVKKGGMAFFFDLSEKEVDEWCVKTYEMTFDEIEDACIYALHPNQDKSKPYTVYMHISPNGKKYIGVTKSTLNKRWRQGKAYLANSHFTNAIVQYGWENIQHAILFMKLTKDEAEEKERELISYFRSNEREYGYNIESGGGLNKVVSQETREKLRRNATGVIPSAETRRKMSESHKGEKCHFYGKHLSEERKEHLRKIKSKGCAQIDDNGKVVRIFSSMKEAAETFGRTRQAISSCCRGETKKCAGYFWRWVDAETEKAT